MRKGIGQAHNQVFKAAWWSCLTTLSATLWGTSG